MRVWKAKLRRSHTTLRQQQAPSRKAIPERPDRWIPVASSAFSSRRSVGGRPSLAQAERITSTLRASFLSAGAIRGPNAALAAVMEVLNASSSAITPSSSPSPAASPPSPAASPPSPAASPPSPPAPPAPPAPRSPRPPPGALHVPPAASAPSHPRVTTCICERRVSACVVAGGASMSAAASRSPVSGGGGAGDSGRSGASAAVSEAAAMLATATASPPAPTPALPPSTSAARPVLAHALCGHRKSGTTAGTTSVTTSFTQALSSHSCGAYSSTLMSLSAPTRAEHAHTRRATRRGLCALRESSACDVRRRQERRPQARREVWRGVRAQCLADLAEPLRLSRESDSSESRLKLEPLLVGCRCSSFDPRDGVPLSRPGVPSTTAGLMFCVRA